MVEQTAMPSSNEQTTHAPDSMTTNSDGPSLSSLSISEATQHHISHHVAQRRSTRAFLPDQPVPQSLLEECLSLAQRAPSNSNLQPWRVFLVRGEALARVSRGLLAAFESNQTPTTLPIPKHYMHHRSAMGRELYGSRGYNIPREAKEDMARARKLNYRFFNAPCAAIVCVDKQLAPIDVLSTGMYMQTLMLLLQERGVASCASVSVAGYPDVLRRELGIGDDMDILSGLCIGYEDESQPISRLRMHRAEWRDNITFVTD